MAAKGRRRRAPAVYPQLDTTSDRAEQESAPTPEDGADELDNDNEGAEPADGEQTAPQPEPEADMVAEKYIALGRVKYTKRGEGAVVAEAGDYLDSPVAQDLAELQEAGLVETFDTDVIDALRSAMAKNKEAVRKILGL